MVANLATSAYEALARVNTIVPLTSGGTLGFSLSNASVGILSVQPQTQRLTFHNPGSVTIYVCQATDANGNALVAGPNPGSWAIFGGGTLVFTGNGVAGAWNAAAASAGSNPLTVQASQTV
jgi:hypothetical protein